jgi:hypothetical protein
MAARQPHTQHSNLAITLHEESGEQLVHQSLPRHQHEAAAAAALLVLRCGCFSNVGYYGGWRRPWLGSTPSTTTLPPTIQHLLYLALQTTLCLRAVMTAPAVHGAEAATSCCCIFRSPSDGRKITIETSSGVTKVRGHGALTVRAFQLPQARTTGSALFTHVQCNQTIRNLRLQQQVCAAAH